MILITIRRIQLKKELQEIGAGILLLLGILWALIYGSYHCYLKMPHAIYFITALFFLCLHIQLTRKDKSFVYTCIEHPKREIFTEYVFLTFPFSVTVLFTSNWYLYPILLIALAIIPTFSYSAKHITYLKKISRVISPKDFELISFFRKSFIYIVPIYILALAFCWFRFFPLILLWFLAVCVSSGFIECEPLNILKAQSLPPSSFLKKKITRNLKYLFVLMLPIVIINTIFNPQLWLFNLLFIPTQLALFGLAICLKYSNFEPGRTFIGNSLLLSLVSGAAILPYCLPVVLIIAMTYYKKAVDHLKNYLHD
jgi:hypothetical protein